MIYRLIRELVRLSAYIFYRRIEVVGLEHIPTTGATLFFGNHPNSLLDPALITAFGERKIHFMAKEALFTKPLLNILLAQMGAVPVKRRQDQKEGALNNDQSFEALYQLLEQGGAMGIFPEGISHNGTQLAELKTGAARIALEMKSRGVQVQFVPCGLTYLTRDRFRSSVLVQFGEALTLDDLIDDDQSPRAITQAMELHLRALTINAETWEELSLLDTVRRLYQPERISIEQRVELARRFNQYYPTIKQSPNIQSLIQKVQEYQEELYLLGLSDKEISASLTPRRFIMKLAHHSTLALIWLPLAIIGSPIHMPLALMLGHGSRVMAPRKDVVATTKFIAGFLLLNTLYIGLGLWTWSQGYTWQSFFVPFLFALSGFACLKLAERGRSLWRTLWIWTHCLAAKNTIKELRRHRKQLRSQVLEAVDLYLPKGVDRMFYQQENDQQKD